MKQLLENLIALYFLSADAAYLKTMQRLLANEIADPVLQKTILVLDTTTIEDVETQMQTVGALVVSTQACTNCLEQDGKYVPSGDAEVIEGKLIRVYAADTEASPESTECFVMSVVTMTTDRIILVAPPTPNLDDMEDSQDDV